MKTLYEKDDVSEFRQYIREKRFLQPNYEEQITSFLSRIEGDEPPIVLVTAKNDKKENIGPLDIVGIGKTDFAYFTGNYIREKDKQIKVLAFPDIVDHIERGLSFYSSVFVPEVMRVTSTKFDMFYKILKMVEIVIKSFTHRMVLLLRVNVLLTIGLVAFLIGAISLDDIFSHQLELTSLVSVVATPLVTILFLIIWLLVVLDKIRRDDKYLFEWNENSLLSLKQSQTLELANVSPQQLLRRLSDQDTVIILDDASHIDSQSLDILIEMVLSKSEKTQRGKKKNHIGLVLVSDEVSERKQQDLAQEGNVAELLSEFKCKRNNWLCFDLTPPKLYELEWLLWGFFDTEIPWQLVKKLVVQYPALENNSGFLLQFLYDETTILENQKDSLKNIHFEKILQDYESFSREAEYKLLAENILAKISEDILIPCKEFLKYLLAFHSPIRNSEIIHTLLEKDGFIAPKKFGDFLIGKQILKMRSGSYVFVRPSDKSTLELSWAEWVDNKPVYYSKVFNKIHDYSTNKKLIDNPLMAKMCEPSYLVIDTLWREGDALYFFGGNANIQTSLEYYGIDKNGALSKWYEIFTTDFKNSNISDRNFYWKTDAKNSPYRYKTSRSPRSDSFIGDLVQVAAALCFSAGEYEKSFYILGSLWNEIKHSCWNSFEVTDDIKNKIKNTDINIQFQLSDYFIAGPVKEENWRTAEKTLRELNLADKSARFESKRQVLLHRINHSIKYGAGNLPSSLFLIRDVEIEQQTQFLETRSIASGLYLSQIYFFYYRDVIRYRLNNQRSQDNCDDILAEMKSTLVSMKKANALFEKRADKSFKYAYPLMDLSFYPIADAEEEILVYKGLWQYFNGLYLYYRYFPTLEQSKSKNNLLERGKSIRKYFELNEKMWNEFCGIFPELSDKQDLILIRNLISVSYNKFMFSEKPTLRDLRIIEHEMRKNCKVLLKKIEETIYLEALQFLRLASDLSSIKLLRHNEILANYYQADVLITLNRSSPSIENKQHFERITSLISTNETKDSLLVSGHANDSFRYHARVAEFLGEKRFEEVYLHYEKARTICEQLGSFIPSIVKGQIISHQLQLLGSVISSVKPNDILILANQALEIFNSYSGDEIPSDHLENHKAHVRWWIAEACARLSKKGSDNYTEYFENAKQHLNWIERQAKGNQLLQRQFGPKVQQVYAHFYDVQGDYKQALQSLRDALDEFDDRLFEQIQTLELIIEVSLTQVKKNKDKKDFENFLGSLLNFRSKLVKAMRILADKRVDDLLHYKTCTGAVTCALLLITISKDSTEVESALELFTFGITGLFEWRMAGRAAIELSRLKKMSNNNTEVGLPVEFENFVKQCVTEWDPRRELINKLEVENALGTLIGINVSVEKRPENSNDKYLVLDKARMLLSRPTPDTKGAYETLEAAIETVNTSDPVSEDVDLVRLLKNCCSKEGSIEKSMEYDQLLIKLSETLASKVYLEIANAFSASSEIHARYLHMAATVGENEFSNEANKKISHVLNVEGIKKRDLSKDELEKTNYMRLMNLPVDEYDIAEAYNLLFLFENELRRLIAHRFNQHSGWWKKGVPNDIYDRVRDENGKRIKGSELLNSITLGDLFKIVKFGDNWEQLFKNVFYSRNLLVARETIILPVRNRIAHTDRDLSLGLIKEYVIAAKNMVNQMQPFLPK
ncbi:MAG: hypothetical protein HN390_00990 [Anaerolineae bacterium]|jgi:hypothetical protein|nr:hypothetical protein [Anaerolineae bacterium]MBT7189171.1 hypothetical protein [Anaerolineae bacterium]